MYSWQARKGKGEGLRGVGGGPGRVGRGGGKQAGLGADRVEGISRVPAGKRLGSGGEGRFHTAQG